jgi:hypothetical protein
VEWLGAVQAQDFAAAKWALGLRLQGVTDDDIEQAFTDGTILRTHVMRPTWHFVSPADIRWLLALTAPRVHAASGYYNRKLELDDAVFRCTNAVLANALQGGKQLTRDELASALQQAGIATEGEQRVTHIMMRAEAAPCSPPDAHRTLQTASSVYLYFKQPTTGKEVDRDFSERCKILSRSFRHVIARFGKEAADKCRAAYKDNPDPPDKSSGLFFSYNALHTTFRLARDGTDFQAIIEFISPRFPFHKTCCPEWE